MLEYEPEVMKQFGRAFRLMEGWIEAGLLSELREAVLAVYGDSSEHRLLEVLLQQEESLPLYEIASKCGMSRRAVLQDGRIRGTLCKLAKEGILVNTGTQGRPRYLLNREDGRVRFIVVILRGNPGLRVLGRANPTT